MNNEACKEILSNETTVQRIVDFTRTDDGRLRYDMVKTLRNVKKESRGPILAALDDKDIRVRRSVLSVWDTIHDDSRIIPIVLRRLGADSPGNDSDPIDLQYKERASLITMLQRYPMQIESKDKILPLLIEALDHDSVDVRNN
jgi:HEAT repeat protein